MLETESRPGPEVHELLQTFATIWLSLVEQSQINQISHIALAFMIGTSTQSSSGDYFILRRWQHIRQGKALCNVSLNCPVRQWFAIHEQACPK